MRWDVHAATTNTADARNQRNPSRARAHLDDGFDIALVPCAKFRCLGSHVRLHPAENCLQPALFLAMRRCGTLRSQHGGLNVHQRWPCTPGAHYVALAEMKGAKWRSYIAELGPLHERKASRGTRAALAYALKLCSAISSHVWALAMSLCSGPALAFATQLRCCLLHVCSCPACTATD